MAISTYTELKSAVADWLHRSDLTSVIPDFITLAEERFNRKLRTRFQETSLASTGISNYQISIPANTVAVKQLWRVDGSDKLTLQAVDLEYVLGQQNGSATCYAWEGSTWQFDGTGNVAGVLYRNIPDLASNSTNWLLTSHPSLYLYATLAEAAAYTREPESEAMWRARAEGLMSELNRTAQADAFSGPLTIRVR